MIKAIFTVNSKRPIRGGLQDIIARDDVVCTFSVSRAKGRATILSKPQILYIQNLAITRFCLKEARQVF